MGAETLEGGDMINGPPTVPERAQPPSSSTSSSSSSSPSSSSTYRIPSYFLQVSSKKKKKEKKALNVFLKVAPCSGRNAVPSCVRRFRHLLKRTYHILHSDGEWTMTSPNVNTSRFLGAQKKVISCYSTPLKKKKKNTLICSRGICSLYRREKK